MTVAQTFGNFVVIAAFTSLTVASSLTSIVKGKPRANVGGFAAADTVNDTIGKCFVENTSTDHFSKFVRTSDRYPINSYSYLFRSQTLGIDGVAVTLGLPMA